jgi:hypothetical protein
MAQRLTSSSNRHNWYARQCDGDWAHQDGIEINTLDNRNRRPAAARERESGNRVAR